MITKTMRLPRKILFVLLVTSSLLVCHRGICHLFRVDAIVMRLDPRLNSDLQAIMHKECTACAVKTVFDVQSLIVHLKDRFPFIAAINALYAPDGIVRIAIQSQNPLYRVNECVVLTDQGQLCAGTVFESHFVASLRRTITLDPAVLAQANPDTALQQSLSRIPQHIFERYHLEWQSPLCIRVFDKKNPGIVMLCDVDHLPDDALLDRYMRIKTDLASRSMVNDRKQKGWVIDMRFADQIIVCADVGGKKHGAHIS